ncbi:hypothetical protein [Flavobacterium akiainvivens]|nr:hypothetical protein [Flavobacterium akiainvivens]
MLTIEALSYIIEKWSDNNMILLHIYSFVELSFMLYLYKKEMFRKPQRFLTILGIAGLCYIFAEMLLIFVFKGLSLKDFSPYAKVADNFIIILFALAFISERVNHFQEKEWGNFRLNIIFLVFFTINTLFFLPFNFMVNAGTITKFYFFAGHLTILALFYLYLTFEIINNSFNKLKKGQ